MPKSDAAFAASVIATDDEIDRRYQEIERRAIDLMGRQQPVASDLRLLVALIHMALHLERIGDMVVNIPFAEATRSAASLPAMPEVLRRLQDIGRAAASMTDMAVEAFTRRDRQMCELLPEFDDHIDQLDREMASHVLAHSARSRAAGVGVADASRVALAGTRRRPCRGHRRAGVVPDDRGAARARLTLVAGCGDVRPFLGASRVVLSRRDDTRRQS